MNPGVEFTVRTAAPGDVPKMHRIRMSVRENHLSDPQRISEASYAPFIAARSAWVAESSGRVLGFAAIDAAAASVWALFVDPAAEGCGAGRALHRRMVEWAREHGIEGLSLATEAGTRAAGFYRRAGWTETGTDEDGQAVFALVIGGAD